MKLNKYTWNNGTQSSPIILTNDQIKKFIAIGQHKDIESKVSGYITTSSRKMQKFLKYALQAQFKDLNIICDEELADKFTIALSTNTIKEGTRELISIDTDSGINHSFLKWKYDFSNFVIDGDISEQNIKDRIRVENGYLVVGDPKENASWSVQLTLTAYPSYYSEEEFNKIPASSKPDTVLTIVAKKIEDISISTESEVPINSKVEISVSPVPADSTKLKGATYSYSTTTPDILNINTSSQGTTITTKKQGTANLIVTLHACNNTVTKSNSTTFNVYGLRPVVFIIDQRYSYGLSDPDGMVSENCILNSDGSLTSISNSGSVGNPSNNTLTWLRQNTHAYVSRNVGLSGVRLKQLSDSNRKMFADGTSAASYISNESGEFDVLLKFGSDIYYKTEAWTPKGQSKPDSDYVAVTIAKEIPTTEDASKWCKWSQYKLIGVYPACKINNKLYSLSGKHAANTLRTTGNSLAKARGENFSICDYDMTKLFAFLFYGYYSSLASQQICGYGTKNEVKYKQYPKITGSTDNLGMTDTDVTTGNGADNPSESQIIAGIGSDIKTVNFWGLESCWGDVLEHLAYSSIAQAYNPDNNAGANPSLYVADYIAQHDSTTITKPDGTDTIYTSKAKFLEDYKSSYRVFLKIYNPNLNTNRFIEISSQISTGTVNITRMIFGAHADIIPKLKDNNSSIDTGFCDTFGYVFNKEENIVVRSGYNNISSGGISYLFGGGISGVYASSDVGARIMYNGDERTVHVIDDATEEL